MKRLLVSGLVFVLFFAIQITMTFAEEAPLAVESVFEEFDGQTMEWGINISGGSAPYSIKVFLNGSYKYMNQNYAWHNKNTYEAEVRSGSAQEPGSKKIRIELPQEISFLQSTNLELMVTDSKGNQEYIFSDYFSIPYSSEHNKEPVAAAFSFNQEEYTGSSEVLGSVTLQGGYMPYTVVFSAYLVGENEDELLQSWTRELATNNYSYQISTPNVEGEIYVQIDIVDFLGNQATLSSEHIAVHPTIQQSERLHVSLAPEKAIINNGEEASFKITVTGGKMPYTLHTYMEGVGAEEYKTEDIYLDQFNYICQTNENYIGEHLFNVLIIDTLGNQSSAATKITVKPSGAISLIKSLYNRHPFLTIYMLAIIVGIMCGLGIGIVLSDHGWKNRISSVWIWIIACAAISILLASIVSIFIVSIYAIIGFVVAAAGLCVIWTYVAGGTYFLPHEWHKYHSYKAGQYCTYEGKSYKCIMDDRESAFSPDESVYWIED